MQMDTHLADKPIHEILTGSQTSDTAAIDRVLSILAQVSLAVLIIFIMIAILFASSYKDQALYYKQRSEELANTPEKQALIALQRQKLLLAFEKTNHDYRLRLGHLTFYRTDAQHRRVVHTENIITGRKIRYDFLKACDFAKQELADFDAFRQKYMEIVMSRADLVPSGTEPKPDILDEQNKSWFADQVRASTTSLYEDTIRLQEDAKEGLAKYYQTNLSEISELRDLADTLTTTPTRDQIDSFTRTVNQFVENELERQNVKFLVKSRKTEG